MVSNKRLLILGLIFCLMPGFIFSVQGAEKYVCHFTTGKIVVDGVINEPAWEKADKIEFYLLPPKEGKFKRPTSPTIARLLWDNNYLYIAMEAKDADIWGTIEGRDGPLWSEDVLEIFVKPRQDSFQYYEFEFGPKGALLDIFFPSRGLKSFAMKRWAPLFNPPIKHAVKINGTLNNWRDRDEGWTLEVAIPFDAFSETTKTPPRVGDKWRFGLCRYDYSVYLEAIEYSSSAQLSRVDFHLYEDYDILSFQK